MEAAKLALLKADINAQQATINRIFGMLENRASDLSE
jgi:hypothetical protein